MRAYVDRIFSAFEVNVVPIIVTLGSCYILAEPAQFREIYRGFAQRVASLQTVGVWSTNPDFWGAVTAAAYTIVALTLLTILIWLTCRLNFGEKNESNVVSLWRRIVSLGLAALPFLSLAAGFYAASSSADAVEKIKKLLAVIKEGNLRDLGTDPSMAGELAAGWANQIASYNIILIGLAVVFAVVGLLLVFLLNRFENSSRADAVGRVILGGPAVLAASAVFLALCALFSTESGALAVRISAVPTLCLFAALSLVVGNYLTLQSGATGRLVIWLFAIAAIVFSVFDLSNNHRVRRVELSAQASPAAPELSDTFLAWYDARTDRTKFQRYPLYVVAAQGGGIYAALHAASFLGYMQQRCPNFAHHLFAISSVSGGSIGAAVFAASMKEAERRAAVKIPARGCNDREAGSEESPEFLDAATEVLGGDFWSPLQAMALFPDLLQRFLPIWVERFDRARALERGLEASWQAMITKSELFGPRTKAQTGNIMAEPFASLWPEGFGKSSFTPALILNTTEVDSGRRRLIAPFTFQGLTDIRFFPLDCVLERPGQAAKTESVPLSTAAVLSARFPWVTPTAWFYETPEMGKCIPSERDVTKVSDGGFFENSGVASALDLTYSLQKIIEQRKLPVDIKLIILTSGGFATDKVTGLSEALDPIRTMLNASGARGYIEVDRAEQASGAQNEPPTASAAALRGAEVLKVKLEGLGYPLPLGWSVSTVTSYLIQFQTGDFDPCQRSASASGEVSDVHSSSCVIGDLVGQLTYR
jgi:hypothetical protein